MERLGWEGSDSGKLGIGFFWLAFLLSSVFFYFGVGIGEFMDTFEVVVVVI